MRDPRQLPEPGTQRPAGAVTAPDSPSIDPNPEEPYDQQNQQRRRRRATSSSSSPSFSDFSAAASDQSQHYAETKATTKRVKEMCTNEYLHGIGVTPHPQISYS